MGIRRSASPVRTRFSKKDTIADLVRAACDQDEDAVVALIKRCEHQVAAALSAAGVRHGDPLYDDARNSALLEIWKQFPNFRHEASPCTWMYQIARRVTGNKTIRHEQRQRQNVSDIRSKMTADDFVMGDAGDGLADRDLLEQVLSKLSDDDREILMLRVVLEMEVKEVAEVLFLSEGGVKSRLRRARKAAIAVRRSLEP